jgi:hypothetical protein
MSSLQVDNLQTYNSNPPVIKNVNGTEVGTFCRAWVNFNGTGTVAIRASFNVGSITDNGTGDFTVNFTTALADANYSVVSAGSQQANDCISISSSAAPTTSAVRIQGYSRTDSFTAQDGTYNNIAIFR